MNTADVKPLPHDRIRAENHLPPVNETDRQWARDRFAGLLINARSYADLARLRDRYWNIYLHPDEQRDMANEEIARRRRLEQLKQDRAVLLRPAIAPVYLRPAGFCEQESDVLLRANE